MSIHRKYELHRVFDGNLSLSPPGSHRPQGGLLRLSDFFVLLLTPSLPPQAVQWLTSGNTEFADINVVLFFEVWSRETKEKKGKWLSLSPSLLSR